MVGDVIGSGKSYDTSSTNLSDLFTGQQQNVLPIKDNFTANNSPADQE